MNTFRDGDLTTSLGNQGMVIKGRADGLIADFCFGTSCFKIHFQKCKTVKALFVDVYFTPKLCLVSKGNKAINKLRSKQFCGNTAGALDVMALKSTDGK